MIKVTIDPKALSTGLLSDYSCQCIDPLSDCACPQPVLKWGDQHIIWVNGLQTGQGFEIRL